MKKKYLDLERYWVDGFEIWGGKTLEKGGVKDV